MKEINGKKMQLREEKEAGYLTRKKLKQERCFKERKEKKKKTYHL